MAYPALGVDEIEGRPVVVGECAPNTKVVVDSDRIVDLPGLDRPPHVVEVVLELELGRVHADRDEAMIAIPLRPGPVVRLSAQPVDARVRPELNDDDMAA